MSRASQMPWITSRFKSTAAAPRVGPLPVPSVSPFLHRGHVKFVRLPLSCLNSGWHLTCAGARLSWNAWFRIVTIRWLCRPLREPLSGVDLVRHRDQSAASQLFVSGSVGVQAPSVNKTNPTQRRWANSMPTARRSAGKSTLKFLHWVIFVCVCCEISLFPCLTSRIPSPLIDFQCKLNLKNSSLLNYLDDTSEQPGQRWH